jgi:outer membrane receptor for monomeric catechols
MKIPANPAKASADSNVDAFTIVYAPGYRVANANDGYQRSVSAIYQIRLNLNIDNLLADTKLRFMSTNLRPR